MEQHAFILTPHTQAQCPKLYAQYKPKLPKREKVRLHAAERALYSGACEQMAESDLSTQNIPSLITKVKCENGTQFSFKEEIIMARIKKKEQ